MAPFAGEAVTELVDDLDSLLSSVGESFIHDTQSDTSSFDALMASPGIRDNVIIFHFGIGNRSLTEAIVSRPERLIVVFHGLPNFEAFVPFDAALGGVLTSAPVELRYLAERTALAVAFNQNDERTLAELGFRNICVAKPLYDPTLLLSVEPFAPTMNHFANGVDGPVIVANGQLWPHRRLDLLLQSYSLLITNLLPEANLVITGASSMSRYHQYVDDILKGLNLHKAGLFGAVSQPELAATYRSADLAISLTTNDDYVALATPMAFGVPVVTTSTIEGALSLPFDSDPTVIAEAMHEVLTNQAVRDELIEAGRGQVASLDLDAAKAELLTEILTVAR